MADLSLAAAVAEIKKNPGKFYVYVLSRPDGSPFYVGCGKVKVRGFERITFHEREAKAGLVASHKCNTIRLIWNSGGTVGYRIDSWHGSEVQMFAHEVGLIERLGRADLGTGRLTNWSAGGDGLVSRSDEVRQRASETMLLLVDDEWRARSSKLIKAHWDSEEGRAKRISAIARPEARQARIAASLRQNSNPEIISRKSAAMLARWKDDAGYREKQNAALRAAVSTDEHRAKQGQAAKARWSDPEYRERVRASQRARWQRLKSK